MRPILRLTAGFTVVELMLTVAIAAVILALAVPSFGEFVARTRVATATSDFVSLFSFGRSEAIKRGARIVVCRSSDGTACDGSGWGDGAAVFVDRDGDNAIDSDEEILRALTDIPESLTLSASGNVTHRIVFLPQGFVLGDGEILVSGGDTDKKKRCLHVAPSGRVEARAYYAGCGSA